MAPRKRNLPIKARLPKSDGRDHGRIVRTALVGLVVDVVGECWLGIAGRTLAIYFVRGDQVPTSRGKPINLQQLGDQVTDAY
jgi:hypothetical protein